MLNIASVEKWYLQDNEADAVHDIAHVGRVTAMAGHLAQLEGADLEIVRTAALLHDIEGRKEDGGGRARHHLYAAEFAGKLLTEQGWPDVRIAAVQHCIRSHRFRDESEQPESIEAKVLFDADKLDAIGAVGIARAVAYAAQHGEPFYAKPSKLFLESGQKEAGETHTAYHEYLFKLRKLIDRILTNSGRLVAQERNHFMEAYFRRLEAEIRGEQ
ncbi:MAG: HD domain-containing protein [Anaerolineaceae bacterium]|nr:HD domain-containing protein [Anaerolineaceae bacterium]